MCAFTVAWGSLFLSKNEEGMGQICENGIAEGKGS